MEILAENYIWFIIGVAIILMTIIGYIADKTNFGKKEFSKRKGPENSKVQKKTIEELEEEAKRPEPKKEEKNVKVPVTKDVTWKKRKIITKRRGTS